MGLVLGIFKSTSSSSASPLGFRATTMTWKAGQIQLWATWGKSSYRFPIRAVSTLSSDGLYGQISHIWTEACSSLCYCLSCWSVSFSFNSFLLR